jgi:hypothetical protein
MLERAANTSSLVTGFINPATLELKRDLKKLMASTCNLASSEH